jgi:hypothetical protein
LEKRPFTNDSIKKFEETSKKKISVSITTSSVDKPQEKSITKQDTLNVNKLSIGGMQIGKKTSDIEQPKSPGRLIKSPKTEKSTLISAGIINKSPGMQSKTLLGNKNDNVLDKLGMKKSPKISVTKKTGIDDFNLDGGNEEDEEFKTGKIKRKIATDVKTSNLKEVPMNNIDGDEIEYDDDADYELETGEKLEDDIKTDFEGYLYKLTKTKKLKKMYFRLVSKDMYCK